MRIDHHTLDPDIHRDRLLVHLSLGAAVSTPVYRTSGARRAQPLCSWGEPRLPLLMRRPDQEGDEDGGDQEPHGSDAVPALGWRLIRPADHGGGRGGHHGGRYRIGSRRGGSLIGDAGPRPEVGCGRFLPVLDLRERAPHDQSIRRQRVGRGWARPGPRNGRGRWCGHRRHSSRRGRRRRLRWGRRRPLRWSRGGLGARRRRFGRRRGRLHRFARVCRERSAHHREHGHRHRRDQLPLHVRSRLPPHEGTTPRSSSFQTRTVMNALPRTRTVVDGRSNLDDPRSVQEASRATRAEPLQDDAVIHCEERNHRLANPAAATTA
jgi:hypothetical protein